MTLEQKKNYDMIIEKAIVDCYDEEEQMNGWVCLIGENMTTPCRCRIAGQDAILEKIDTDNRDSTAIGIIRLGKSRLEGIVPRCFSGYPWCYGLYRGI